jgi:hypothetical protein
MITFKTIEEKDQSFIEQVYRSTREKELSSTNWPEEQKKRFVIMQSMAQELEYRNKFSNAHYQLILYKKQPAGRLYIREKGSVKISWQIL